MESGYQCAAFHPDGVILGTGTQDGLVLVWEVKQQKVRRLLRTLNTCAWSELEISHVAAFGIIVQAKGRMSPA